MRKTAIVILNFNGRDYLKQFLPSVIEYSTPHEVVVIDNASTDDSLDLLNKDFPTVKVIPLPKNLGFSGGYNEGLKKVDADYIVLLNSDIEVSPNWVDPVVEFLENSPDVAACQPKILDFKKKTHFEYAGAGGGFIDALGYPFCRGRLFQSLEEDHGQYNDTREVFWASGACFFVRKEVFEKLGGLEEEFFAHMEEIDFCWRIWNHGLKVAVCPESTVYHVGGGTLEHAHPRKTYLNFRNGLAILVKNERWTALLWKLPFRILLDWVAMIQFSLVSGPVHAFSIIKAHFHFTTRIGRFISKRSQIPSRRIIARYPRLIVWQYYILGKRKFSELP